MNQPEPIPVAVAILHQQGHFLLQLRDNIPTIVYPGHWSCFGGHIEPGESPSEAMTRELLEEINFHVTAPQFYRMFSDTKVARHIFVCPLTVPLATLELNEGWDLGLFTATDIQQGHCFSTREQTHFPLAAPHQQLLLDYIHQTNPSSAPA